MATGQNLIPGGNPGQVKNTQKPKSYEGRLPFMSPDAACNARLVRRGGYCKAPAGNGTQHVGLGRCYLHGGMSPAAEGVDGPRDLFRAAGLEGIINLAETMTHDDQEYLMAVGNNALVVTRAGILARMQGDQVSPKELADLTMALSRVDTILAKFPDDEDPDAAPNTPDFGEADEMARLEALDRD